MQYIERTVELEDGKKVKFTAGPKHPFWVVSFESGPVPEELKGQFTDFNEALHRVEVYLARREKVNRRTSVRKDSVETRVA